MTKSLEAKLKKLPLFPGVYFHKDKNGAIIYVGKAANLRNRVRQYFQASRYRDLKTDLLVNEITDVDWIELESEADALFLEAELIRRYQPRYNIMLRDDKSLQYIRIDYNSDYPTVTMIRRPLDDGARYFGPYINGYAIKKALRYLRKAFPYAISRPVNQKRSNLYYHLGLDPGLEDGKTSLNEYRSNLRKLMEYLKGNRKSLIKDIEKEMQKAAKAQQFERAAQLRNQLYCLQQLNRQVLFGDRELLDASRDHALVELADMLQLDKPATRIEGFDISHVQGSDNVASMVVFVNGIPAKTSYRKFKMRIAGNDDFVHMREVITRRYREENVKKWGLPELILIDGGKGQLSAAITALQDRGHGNIPAIGLAKKFEEIIVPNSSSINQEFVKKCGGYIKTNINFSTVILPENSNIVKLLGRIRDESHRFAVSYHSTLRSARQTTSLLDEIPGIGPLTRKKLIRHFGSLKQVTEASSEEMTAVIGTAKAASIKRYFKPVKKS